jgi:hypothetical protein
MKRLLVLLFVLPLMLAISQAPVNASGSGGGSLTIQQCNADYCSRCDGLGGECVQHTGFCDCHVS